jgi:NADH-quinone oxidoreductase subunit L
MDLSFDPQADFRLLFAAWVAPLAGYVIQIFLGRYLPRRGDWLLIGLMGFTAAVSVVMAAKAIAAAYAGAEFFHHSGAEAGLWFHWLFSSQEAAGAAENVSVGLLYDPLGAAMLAVVGVVSFCVHLFSAGYMHGDKRYHVFFANISLFTFAMLGLVLADNVLFLFVFWEIMGLMSYLLIGHFAHDPGSGFFRWATWACKKAFMTTRVGDVCLLVGILMFHYHFGTFAFTELWRLGAEEVARNGGEFPTWMTVAGLFVFGGTMGKSAQFPLHIWLPDAMAGPTPVSAMIHAATMVAAGVFLLGRMFPLFSPDALAVITVVGAFTALFAATIGCVQWDLKAVLAYSTISQLGFMVAAVGLGGWVAGMFHMVTHAFFKACLFLSAGSVIHGCHHEQDMRLMGGLRRYMPVTFACMAICTFAISGIPLFAGFYSKDMILMQGFINLMERFEGWSLFALVSLSLAACLTCFYMFRMLFLTFFGEYRGNQPEHRYSQMLALHGRGGHIVYHDHLGEAGGHGRGHDEQAHRDHAHHDPAHHGAKAHGHAGHGHEAHAHAAHGHEAHGHEAHAYAHEAHAHAHARDAHGHGGHVPHESPLPILVAICLLALLGFFGGHFWPLEGDPLLSHSTPWFVKLVSAESAYGHEVAAFLEPHAGPEELAHHEHVHHEAHAWAFRLSTAIVLVGLSLASLLYLFRRDLPAKLAASLGLIYETVRDKYYVDEVVDATVIRGSLWCSRAMTWFDGAVVDGLVNLAGRTGKLAGSFSAWVDRTFVDGAVNGAAALTNAFGSLVRLVQTGRVQQYATFAVAGGLAAAAWLILS